MTKDDDFDPEELEEIAKTMDRIFANETEGYEMIFWINHNDAVELVTSYKEVANGDPIAIARCFYEFGKIVYQLEGTINEDN